MTPRLDRDRPHGTVLPSNLIWQDGHYFDVHGAYLRSDEPAPEPQSAEPRTAPAHVERQGAGGGTSGGGNSAADIDLAAWAKGEAKYPHYSVVKHVKAEYPDAAEVANTRAALVDFLVGKGVVTEAEAVR